MSGRPHEVAHREVSPMATMFTYGDLPIEPRGRRSSSERSESQTATGGEAQGGRVSTSLIQPSSRNSSRRKMAPVQSSEEPLSRVAPNSARLFHFSLFYGGAPRPLLRTSIALSPALRSKETGMNAVMFPRQSKTGFEAPRLVGSTKPNIDILQITSSYA